MLLFIYMKQGIRNNFIIKVNGVPDTNVRGHYLSTI